MSGWLEELPASAKVYIYGSGKYGDMILRELKYRRPDVSFKGFIDTYRRGKNIISWSEFQKKKPECDVIIIGSEKFWKDMVRNVDSLGYKFLVPTLYKIEISTEEEKALKEVEKLIDNGKDVYNLIVDAYINRDFDAVNSCQIGEIENMYFDFISFSSISTVIEGGVYRGEVSKKILNKLGSLGRIYGFDINGSKFLPSDLIEDKRFFIYKLALWSEGKTLYFPKDFPFGGGTYVTPEKGLNTEPVKAVSVDKFVTDNNVERVDFIKMDIEGAEEEALRGAKEVIRDFKPQMAICVYHKLEHFYKIPLLIKDIFGGYKIYFRHYSHSFADSVMYFIPS